MGRCEEVQPDPSTAKVWVKKPGGAIRRNDRIVLTQQAGHKHRVSEKGVTTNWPEQDAVLKDAQACISVPGALLEAELFGCHSL
jgi:hypothetical protein